MSTHRSAAGMRLGGDEEQTGRATGEHAGEDGGGTRTGSSADAPLRESERGVERDYTAQAQTSICRSCSYMMCAAYIQIHAQTSALRVLRTPSCLDTVLLLYSALTTMLMLHMVVGAFGLMVTTHDDTRR